MSSENVHLLWFAQRINNVLDEVCAIFKILKPTGIDAAAAEVVAAMVFAKKDVTTEQAISVAQLLNINAEDFLSRYNKYHLIRANYRHTTPAQKDAVPSQGCLSSSGGRLSNQFKIDRWA